MISMQNKEDIKKYYVLGSDLGWGKYGIVKSGCSISSPNLEVAIKVINLKLIQKKYK